MECSIFWHTKKCRKNPVKFCNYLLYQMDRWDSRVQKGIENFVFIPKMAIFWRAEWGRGVASGSGNPPPLISALRKIAVLGLKMNFSILFCTRLYYIMSSEKATKFWEISPVDLPYVVPVKSTVEILPNFEAFSEYMSFIHIEMTLGIIKS